jgi:hypothetical protein
MNTPKFIGTKSRGQYSLLCAVILAALFALPTAAYAQQAYEVGGKGPAGGLIFYDKGRVTDGWRYLEAAPVEAEFNAEWGPSGQEIAGLSEAAGSGRNNTRLIVEYLSKNGESGKAAQLCASLNYGGYRDWFLASKDELNMMYQNLEQKGLGDFTGKKEWYDPCTYWSSSQNASLPRTNAWEQSFRNGRQASNVKPTKFYVRPVRAF